jgi:hypothetical protein
MTQCDSRRHPSSQVVENRFCPTHHLEMSANTSRRTSRPWPPSAEDARHLVALHVDAPEVGLLTYAFRDPEAAARMVAFLRSVLPRARFTVEPAFH